MQRPGAELQQIFLEVAEKVAAILNERVSRLIDNNGNEHKDKIWVIGNTDRERVSVEVFGGGITASSKIII